MAILQASDVTAWVPQAANEPSLILAAIARAEGLAAEFLGFGTGSGGYTLESAARDEYLDVLDEQDTVTLAAFPVTAVTSVQTSANSTSPSTLTSTSYTLDSARGHIQRTTGYWTAGKQNVRVQYTAGYTNATAPDGLKFALTQLVAWVIEHRGNVGVTQDSIDGVSMTYEEMDGPVPMSVANLLRPYGRGGAFA